MTTAAATAKPSALAVNPDGIPEDLRGQARWLGWNWAKRKKKWTKPPIAVVGGGAGSHSDPDTWAGYADALSAYRDPARRLAGMGFALTAKAKTGEVIGEPCEIAGIDIDRCVDPETGEVSAWALDVVARMNTYAERSPSGTGIRILFRGRLPEGGRRRDDLGFECYDSNRYLTITGRRLPDAPAVIMDRAAEAAALHAELFPPKPKPQGPAAKPQPVNVDDEALLKAARAAKNGPAFDRLWRGDTSDYGGDDSRADAALCAHLAFYTGGDDARMDRMFRASGLYRDKWDRDDYRAATLAKAKEGIREYYTPPWPKLTVGKKGTESSGDAAAAEEPAEWPAGGDDDNGKHDEPPGAPPQPEEDTAEPARPAPTKREVINAADQNLPEVVGRVWEALKAANEPAWLFRCNGTLTLIDRDDVNRPILRAVTEDRLRGILARQIVWFKVVADPKDKAKRIRVPALPPVWVVKELLALPDDGIPALAGITGVPVFAPDGTLHNEPGYHPASGLFYHPEPGFTVPPVPAQPTSEDRAEARGLIVDELLGDFPFDGKDAGAASRTHAVALLLWPFVAPLVGQGAPLHFLTKATPGTGASLLADVVTLPALGHPCPVMVAATEEEEWRKRITSTLKDRPQYVLVDNVRRKLDSASLCAALTGCEWQDRIMGVSQNARLPVTCAWIATANNPMVSDEIGRRMVVTTLDTGLEQPWLRDPKSFKHPKLREWARENRGRLVWAALVLVQAWLSEGQPAADSTASLGGFERWAEVVGGILGLAGIPGFLGNLEEVNENAAAELGRWRGFVDAWWETHRGGEVGVAKLWQIVTRREAEIRDAKAGDATFITIGEPADREPPMFDLGPGGDQSQKVKLGNLLMKMRNRRFGDRRITPGGKHKGAQLWRLEEVPGESQVSLGESQGDETNRNFSPPSSTETTRKGEVNESGESGESTPHAHASAQAQACMQARGREQESGGEHSPDSPDSAEGFNPCLERPDLGGESRAPETHREPPETHRDAAHSRRVVEDCAPATSMPTWPCRQCGERQWEPNPPGWRCGECEGAGAEGGAA